MKTRRHWDYEKNEPDETLIQFYVFLWAGARKKSAKKAPYYLYKVALMQGDEVKAEEHKKFVMQYGGKLWYRKEIEG